MPRDITTFDTDPARFAGLTQRRIERGLSVGQIDPTTVINTEELLPWWCYIEQSTVQAVDAARREGLI